MQIYYGDFAGWDDVTDAFCIDMPEPNVLFAGYDTRNYEGYAFVLYAQGGNFYEVSGGHCSCYGLEGQWEPEETTLAAVEHRLRVGTPYGPLGVSKLDIYDAIKSRKGR